MGKRDFSIILVPHRSSGILRKRIPHSLLVAGGVVLFLLIGSGLFFFWSFISSVSQEAKLARVEKENSFLSSELGNVKSIIDSLESRLGKLVEKEDAIRAVFGMPEVGQEIRQLGVGGGEYPEPLPAGALWGEDFEEIRADIDELHRRIKFENESLEYIYGEVTGKKELLDHTPSIRPCAGYMSRGFGMKPDPFTGWMHFHQGIDFAAPLGTPVYAPADGMVVFTGWGGALGKVVKINHDHNYLTVFGHLNSIKVRNGQEVRRGQLVGGIGSTGYSTGPHLHYEVHYRGHPTDPSRFIYSSRDLVME
jgi:murein DD-endopeptidase MepM/ murein hydrolase activator NlpD